MSGARPFIVVGDKTDHGGEVLEGSPKAYINGKMIARMGDKVSCPRCRGTHTITGRDPRVIVDGKPAAFHGGKTSCGAVLIATMVDNVMGGAEGSPLPPERDWSFKATAVVTPSEQPVNDEQLQFRNAKGALLTRVQYTLYLANGDQISGTTDDEAKTERVVTDAPVVIQQADLHAPEACCAAHAANSADRVTRIIVPVNVATNTTAVGSSSQVVATPTEQSRGLTSGEIDMARRVFGNSIDYGKVKVHNGEYLWFGMQPDNTAMTPNGEMYFNPKRFQEDFSASSEFGDRLWFMHEMVHVWQHQLGYPVKLRGALRVGLSYEYALTTGRKLSDYNMEAQGNVLSDYWAEVLVGDPPVLWQASSRGRKSDFKQVLAAFIADPADKRNLPGGE